jgi:hypothetical protein
MRTVKATRILTMLRGASELDRVGQFQTADFLLDLARQSMQRVAYDYDYDDYGVSRELRVV